MITPDEIRLKLARRYLSFLQAWLRGESLFPLDLPAGALPKELAQARVALDLLRAGAGTARKRGYRLEEEARHLKSSGRQMIPRRVWVDGEADFLAIIGKQAEFDAFCADVALIRAQFPQLEAWLQQAPQRVIAYQGEWSQLLDVCAFFVANPLPDRYVRELPVGQDTKFIERHEGILRSLLDILIADSLNADETTFARRYGLREEVPPVRIRLLDRQVERRYGLRLDDLTVPVDDLNHLSLTGQRGIIVENKTTLLSLSPLPDTFAIWGQGFSVSMLAGVAWLRDCPLLYWGDLDSQGFQILSSLRSLVPSVRSVLMDESTYNAFSTLAVPGKPTLVRTLPHLTDSEQRLFQWLAERTLRLEQERISPAYALAAIAAALTE